MPKRMHDALKRQAKKKGLRGERKDAYVFGTMARAAKKKPPAKKAPVKKAKPKKRPTKKGY